MESDYEMVEFRNDAKQTLINKLQVISLVSARVVASRISCRLSMEYKVLIETEGHGCFVLWHSYKTFRRFAEQLKTKTGYRDSGITRLPRKQRIPFLNTKNQVAKLNAFLTAAVEADRMRWAIRLNKNTCFVKHRRCQEKTDVRERFSSSASTESCSSSSEPAKREPMSRHARFFYLVRRTSA